MVTKYILSKKNSCSVARYIEIVSSHAWKILIALYPREYDFRGGALQLVLESRFYQPKNLE